MAFLRDLVSILLVFISYQAVVASPFEINTHVGSFGQGRSNKGLGESASVSSFSKLSTSCRLATRSLLAGPFGKCSKLMGLVSILESRESIISEINIWLPDVCSSAPCDRVVLAHASQIINASCRADLEEQSVAAIALYSIINHYNLTRNILCTEHKDEGLCFLLVLNRVEFLSGKKVSVDQAVSLISGEFTEADQAFTSIPNEIYCTDCAHAIVSSSATLIDAVVKDAAGVAFDHSFNHTIYPIRDICDASFEDGALPDTVTIAEPESQGAEPESQGSLDDSSDQSGSHENEPIS